MDIPKLDRVKRSREYNSYSSIIRDTIVYEYLFNGRSHRWLDKNILDLDSEYSRGWQSMGILHHLGLKSAFKGIWKGAEIPEAIKILYDKDTDDYKEVISSLTRYFLKDYDINDIKLFSFPEESPVLYKNIGTSQYTDGVRIDKDFHDIFNPAKSRLYVSRGHARKIKVLFNNKVFDAEYRFEDQTDKSVILQSIRFRKPLQIEFKKVFPVPEGEFTIQQGIDLNHFVFSFNANAVDNEDDGTEYPEGRKAYRKHKVIERNPKVIKDAKKRFKSKNGGRLFCEACNFDFSKKYGKRGDNFIEGHHKKHVSDMKEGEKTKVEDIVMLCANCHRMIHRSPFISCDELRNILISH